MPDEQKKKIVNYPANSHREREKAAAPAEEGLGRDRPKLERVTTTEPVQRKKPLFTRMAESFKGEDVHSVGGYVLFDVALPALKTLIADMVSQGIDRLMFGENAPRRSGGGRSQYTAYNRYSAAAAPARREEPRQISRQARATHDFAEIVLENRGEAQEVLDRLTDLVDNYGDASVAALYELVGTTGSFTDDKWGWVDLRDAHVRPIRGGYLLDLPRPQPLD